MKKINVILLIIILLAFRYDAVNGTNKNNDPMLKDLKVNGESINFEMFTTEYNISVPENIDKVSIEAIPDDENGATFEIIGDLELKDIRNKIEIKVTAEDGIATQSYYIYISKGDGQDANAYLKDIKIEGAELAPYFDKNIINYTFEYPEDMQKLNIEANPEDNEAKVEIIGNENLIQDTQNIEIKVTSKNGRIIKTYYLNARKYKENSKDLEESQEEAELQKGIIEQNDRIKKKNNNLNSIKKTMFIFIIILIIIVVLLKNKKGKIHE